MKKKILIFGHLTAHINPDQVDNFVNLLEKIMNDAIIIDLRLKVISMYIQAAVISKVINTDESEKKFVETYNIAPPSFWIHLTSTSEQATEICTRKMLEDTQPSAAICVGGYGNESQYIWKKADEGNIPIIGLSLDGGFGMEIYKRSMKDPDKYFSTAVAKHGDSFIELLTELQSDLTVLPQLVKMVLDS